MMLQNVRDERALGNAAGSSMMRRCAGTAGGMKPAIRRARDWSRCCIHGKVAATIHQPGILRWPAFPQRRKPKSFARIPAMWTLPCGRMTRIIAALFIWSIPTPRAGGIPRSNGQPLPSKSQKSRRRPFFWHPAKRCSNSPANLARRPTRRSSRQSMLDPARRCWRNGGPNCGASFRVT